MKKLNVIFLVVFLVFIRQYSWAELRVKEYFNYNVGDTLTNASHTVYQTNLFTGTSWNVLTGLGCPTPFVVSTGSLNYPGYIASGEGNKVQFTASGNTFSGLPFGDISSGNIYVSFLVKITSVGTSGSYFFCLGPNNLANNLRAGVFAKKDSNNKLSFGVGIKASTVNSWTGYDYNLGDTCLIVIKYQIKSGSGNDVVSLIVNPIAESTEPIDSLWLNPTNVSTDIALGSIIIRRGTSSSGPTGYIGNIRVATSWTDLMADPQPLISISETVLSGYNYTINEGPSSEKIFKATGENLMGNLSIKAPQNYEISSTSNYGYQNDSIVLIPKKGLVPTTSIYVRLKAGLGVGSYNDSVLLSSNGAFTKSVVCNGSVDPTNPLLVLEENFCDIDTLVGLLNPSINMPWVEQQKGSTFTPITVSSGNLTYPDYFSSGIGNKMRFLGNGNYTAALPFSKITSGTVYLSFLINISNAGTGGYCMGFGTNPVSSTIYNGRLNVKKSGSKIAFGISRKSGVSWTGLDYDLNTTYLIVMKHQIYAGSANDTCSIIVNPVLSSTEPDASSWLKAVDYGTDYDIGSIYIRSGTGSNNPTGWIDGIKVATSWNNLMSEPIPVIMTSQSLLTDFNYTINEGPSPVQTFDLNGWYVKDSIIITPPKNYEISLINDSNFTENPLSIVANNGLVTSTPVYVRLKKDLSMGGYSGNSIVASSGTKSRNIYCYGSVNSLPSTTVSVNMGGHEFSWTFDQAVNYGYFVDGQPWIIVPPEGVNMLSATPARIDSANVYVQDYSTKTQVPTVANINLTVVNPPIGTYYVNGAGAVIQKNAFGWDSRGTVRYLEPNDSGYDPSLSWDGMTPKLLKAGDIVTTPQSITTPTIGETVLDAVAVMTVLSTPPPADAFRPGVVRSAERRINPEFMTLSQIIDVTPYLIAHPSKTVLGLPVSQTVPEPMLASNLIHLVPGPSIMNSGLNRSRSYKAIYNDSGQTYGASLSKDLGKLAIGTIASWLTADERKICQIHFIQRAIDTYEVIQAGCVLTHNGGMLPGYGIHLTIAGKLLNNEGMLSINQSVLGREPMYYLTDYAQMIYIGKEGITEPNTPPVGNPRNNPVTNVVAQLQGLTIPVDSVKSGKIYVKNSFEWPNFRAAHEVLNLKLKVESGQGAGIEYYVVTGISDYINKETGTITNNAATSYIKGGTLRIKPEWVNGIPDTSSVIKSYAVVPSEAPCWAWKGNGVNSNGYYVKNFSLSPDTDYGSVALGAYISYVCTLYALNAQNYYTAGMDQWMIDIVRKPGYGPYLFSESNSLYLYSPNKDGSIPESSFLSGIWKEQVLNKFDTTEFCTESSILSLEIPAPDGPQFAPKHKNENDLLLLPLDDHFDFSIQIGYNSGIVNFKSNILIQYLDVFTLTGVKVFSGKINNYQGSFRLTGYDKKVFIIRAVLQDSMVVRKVMLK